MEDDWCSWANGLDTVGHVLPLDCPSKSGADTVCCSEHPFDRRTSTYIYHGPFSLFFPSPISICPCTRTRIPFSLSRHSHEQWRASPLLINMQLACLVLDTANVVSHCPSHSMSPLHAPCPPWFCVRCDFRHHFPCTAPTPVLPRVPTLLPLRP